MVAPGFFMFSQFLLRRRAGDDQNSGVGAEVLFGGGVDLVDRDGVIGGVAAYLDKQEYWLNAGRISSNR